MLISENQNEQHPVAQSKSHILEPISVFAHQPHDATHGTVLQPVNGLADTADVLKRKHTPETKRAPSHTPSLTGRTTSALLTWNFSKSPNLRAASPDAQKLKTADPLVTLTPIQVPREEDTHDVPSIAFLPEIMSPDVEVVPEPLPAAITSPEVEVVPPPPPPLATRVDTLGPPPFPFGVENDNLRRVSKPPVLPWAKPSTRASSSRSTPVPRDSPISISSASVSTRGHRDSLVPAPTRASTRRRSADLDADADTDSDMPLPKHARTHAALHRPVRARRVPKNRDELGPGNERHVRAPMHELDILREFTPARVGSLRELRRTRAGGGGGEGGEGPQLGLESAAAWAERARALGALVPKVASAERVEGASEEKGTSKDGDAGFGARGPPGAGRWPRGSRVLGQPNTAPTEAYAALLLETFGPGSMLRGEGPRPRLRVEKAKAEKGKKAGAGNRSVSEASSVPASVPDGMDVDSEVGADEGAPSRVGEWIAEIQLVVKGKKLLTRDDLAALADTLWEIADMSEEEGRALGDNGPLLKESLRQLARLDDLPFGDEHGLRQTAKKMVKHWPK
ncbi:Cyclin-domain-containing protein [Mycena sanguinolenta]|uniref:Cyclin-domain-containing protein n=1 Tax=Mycena sanguinolenta TaxID=230812 RepID=A0A8H6YAR6_9AGAR|nr:Cyclin-domain-containing protein [Mycena sanguinolenta]